MEKNTDAKDSPDVKVERVLNYILKAVENTFAGGKKCAELAAVEIVGDESAIELPVVVVVAVVVVVVAVVAVVVVAVAVAAVVAVVAVVESPW